MIENCFSAIRKIVTESVEVCGKKFLDFSKNSSKKATHFYFWYDVGTVDDLIIFKSQSFLTYIAHETERR